MTASLRLNGGSGEGRLDPGPAPHRGFRGRRAAGGVAHGARFAGLLTLFLWIGASCSQSSPGKPQGGAGTGGRASASGGSGSGGSGSGGSGSGGSGSGGAGSGGAGAATSPPDGSMDESDGAPSEPTAEALCPEMPSPRRSSGTVVELQAELRLGDQPLVFGEANDVGGGVTVTPLNVRLYISEVSLIQSDGTSLPVDLVTEDQVPVPYGVQLVNAEDPSSTTLRVLAPPGEYRGLAFTFGLNDACNRGSASRQAPLSEASQMVWPHLAGYLFLRYEARLSSGAEAGSPPDAGALPGSDAPAIHMGGVVGAIFAPVVHADGALSVTGSSPVKKRLRIRIDEIYKGASTPTDLSDFVGIPDPEVKAGERLRRALPNLAVFSLAD